MKSKLKLVDMNKKGNFTKVELDNVGVDFIVDNDTNEVYLSGDALSFFAAVGIEPVMREMGIVKKKK